MTPLRKPVSRKTDDPLGGMKPYAIQGRRDEGNQTIIMDACSFGLSPEDAIHRYLVHLQPRQKPDAFGRVPTIFERHELTAERLESGHGGQA